MNLSDLVMVGGRRHHRRHHRGTGGVGVVAVVESGQHLGHYALAVGHSGGGGVEVGGEGTADGQRHLAPLLYVLGEGDVVEQVGMAHHAVAGLVLVPERIDGLAVGHHAQGVAHAGEGVHPLCRFVEGIQRDGLVAGR